MRKYPSCSNLAQSVQPEHIKLYSVSLLSTCSHFSIFVHSTASRDHVKCSCCSDWNLTFQCKTLQAKNKNHRSRRQGEAKTTNGHFRTTKNHDQTTLESKTAHFSTFWWIKGAFTAQTARCTCACGTTSNKLRGSRSGKATTSGRDSHLFSFCRYSAHC